MILYEGDFLRQAITMATGLRNINRTVSMIRRDPEMTLEEYAAYCRKFQFDSILWIDHDKALKKIDIHDGSIRQMPMPE